jgi:transaldolase
LVDLSTTRADAEAAELTGRDHGAYRRQVDRLTNCQEASVADTYLARVRAATGTRFWVNNPTRDEVELAIAHGAMGCTTNPAYGGNLVRRAPDEVLPVVRDCLALSEDDRTVADLVQQRLVDRIADAFRPAFDRSGGHEGFVSIQGAPDADTDGQVIIHEAMAARGLGPNVTPKLPATRPGLEAMEVMVAAGSPVIVTEVFSLAQLIETCERWVSASSRAGTRPPFFISPITGIFGDHLKKVALRDGIDVPAAVTEMAGVVLSRACYRMVRERAYPVVLLFGGARIQLDFTGLVGDTTATTINWSTAAELLVAEPAIESTISEPVDPAVERQLVEAFPDVRAALDPDALALDAFEGFGPVQHFRDAFIAGWKSVLAMISTERAGLAGGRG